MSWKNKFAKIAVGFGALVGAEQVGEHVANQEQAGMVKQAADEKRKDDEERRARVAEALKRNTQEQNNLARVHFQELNYASAAESRTIAMKIIKDYKNWAFGDSNYVLATMAQLSEHGITKKDLTEALDNDLDNFYKQVDAAEKIGLTFIGYHKDNIDYEKNRPEPNADSIKEQEEFIQNEYKEIGSLVRFYN